MILFETSNFKTIKKLNSVSEIMENIIEKNNGVLYIYKNVKGIIIPTSDGVVYFSNECFLGDAITDEYKFIDFLESFKDEVEFYSFNYNQLKIILGE